MQLRGFKSELSSDPKEMTPSGRLTRVLNSTLLLMGGMYSMSNRASVAVYEGDQI